jgi:hypothetical protein
VNKQAVAIATRLAWPVVVAIFLASVGCTGKACYIQDGVETCFSLAKPGEVSPTESVKDE